MTEHEIIELLARMPSPQDADADQHEFSDEDAATTLYRLIAEARKATS